MHRIFVRCLLSALMLSDGSQLCAQDIYIAKPPEVIIPIGTRPWEGTPQELRLIERVPVPKSYRDRCEGDQLPSHVTPNGCEYQLLVWHFNFGTARSTERALRHISDRITHQLNDLPLAAGRYSELWPAGLAEAKAYLVEQNLTAETFSDEDRLIEERRYPALVELRVLKEKLQKIGHIASLYTSAADWYRSSTLLSEAMRWHEYLSVVGQGDPGQNSPDNARLLWFLAGYQKEQFQDLSLAVARAAVMRTEESILSANLISARAYKEPFDAREFRDQQDRWNAEQFRYLRFRIQLLADAKGLDVTEHQDLYLGNYDFNDIEELIRPEEREMNSIHYLEFGWRGRFAEAIIAQGERDVQLAPERCARGSYYNVQEGLDTLFNAGRVISLAHSPSAYKRIAQHYLELYAILDKCDDEGGMTQITRSPQYRIQARFYQQFLNNYDAIAFGR